MGYLKTWLPRAFKLLRFFEHCHKVNVFKLLDQGRAVCETSTHISINWFIQNIVFEMML